MKFKLQSSLLGCWFSSVWSVWTFAQLTLHFIHIYTLIIWVSCQISLSSFKVFGPRLPKAQQALDPNSYKVHLTSTKTLRGALNRLTSAQTRGAHNSNRVRFGYYPLLKLNWLGCSLCKLLLTAPTVQVYGLVRQSYINSQDSKWTSNLRPPKKKFK